MEVSRISESTAVSTAVVESVIAVIDPRDSGPVRDANVEPEPEPEPDPAKLDCRGRAGGGNLRISRSRMGSQKGAGMFFGWCTAQTACSSSENPRTRSIYR
jgi:hypothetical protein